MSNLGWYQWITTTSKKVKGPLNFMGLLVGGGFAIGVGATAAVNYAREKISVVKEEKKKAGEAAIIYTVTSLGKSNEGLEFNVGEQFRVLERDGDAVLIEKLGNQDNPYFVSAKFLSSISDYRI